jgi:hypothetical protein
MPITQSATKVEQTVAALNPLPRHEQCKMLAQMVFDGSLTAAQGKDALYELSLAELHAPAQPEPSMWRIALQSVAGRSAHG